MAKKRRDNWDRLCKLVEEDDELPTRTIGSWTVNKLWWWNRYIDITTTAMVGNPNWSGGIVYVDLFAGPGVCSLRKSGERRPGSPILALNAPKPFSKILLCEKVQQFAKICGKRIERLGGADRTKGFLEK